jgi:hypothetical protein
MMATDISRDERVETALPWMVTARDVLSSTASLNVARSAGTVEGWS